VTSRVHPVDVDQAPAQRWLEESLSEGFDLSETVQTDVQLGAGTFQVLIPGTSVRHLNFREGGITKTGASYEALERRLQELKHVGAACVLIEDDRWRAGDPAIEQSNLHTGFIGDRVIHWCDLSQATSAAGTETIRMGAFGYPLNAFVSTKSVDELGLVDGQQMPPTLSREVAKSLLAVIVAAFDAETFMVWARV
jgi:hypothetical protein